MVRAIFIGFFLCSIVAVPAAAQTTCRAEIQYAWKRAGEETDRTQYWALVERKAADEAGSKMALEEATGKEKARAAMACHERHESLADCMSGKFNSLASILAGLDFSARNKLQEAIATDCTSQQGICKEAKVGEPQCITKAPPVEEGKKKDEGAGEGKKKKK